MSDEAQSRNPQDVAREALLKRIGQAAEDTTKVGASAQAEALKNLAEAYAFVVSPAQPH
ncbi:hypothetical protein [Streptomyces lunaelactis]|uniref:hypothetical protein n=1 Tax=Streptomyces lunaelactis TaxID=1535768 RepID=UPI001585974A|nr:hypothetical protein [Streptomyces lunaelactis]NUK22048.1 hypothetical protein [Streptomyces lunaelactis]